MPPKERAKWMLGKQNKQKDIPFVNKDNAINACNLIIQVFKEYHPPQNMVCKYWEIVKKELSKF